MGAATLVNADAPAVRVEGLRKRYRRALAVDGVSFEIRPGEIFGLIGADGAGKSSVMKSVAGVLAFDDGAVDTLGVRIDSERAAERVKNRLGFMPQGLGQNLYAELSVEENIDFFAALRAVDRADLRERKARLLAMTRLDRFTDRPMKHLSGGMKQKLGLVCTLIHEPELAILDEPTTGVDPVSRRDFWDILRELTHERRMTALVSTSYMYEATQFDRLALMARGGALFVGAPSEMAGFAPGAIAVCRPERQIETVERLERAFPQVESRGPRVRVFVDDASPAEAAERVREALDGDAPELEGQAPEPEDLVVAALRRRTGEEATTTPDDDGHADLGRMRAGEADGDGVAVEARGLVKAFGDFRAVDDVSFTICAGEIFGLLGANGAGKTTVIKMLTSILAPTGGAGRVAGEDMGRAPHRIKQRIGYVSQVFSLYPDLTVRENIRLYAGVYAIPRRETAERVRWVVRTADLAGREDEITADLPVGVRQRLALGCALVHRPRVLFLDEPTSGIDPIGRRRFWDRLVHLAREARVAILITTHHMSEAERCDRVALMHAGRIVADGTPDDLREAVETDAGRPLNIVTPDAARARAILDDAGFEEAGFFGGGVRVLSPDPDADRDRIRAALEGAGVEIERIEAGAASVEDFFVRRVRALERDERRAAEARA